MIIEAIGFVGDPDEGHMSPIGSFGPSEVLSPVEVEDHYIGILQQIVAVLDDYMSKNNGILTPKQKQIMGYAIDESCKLRIKFPNEQLRFMKEYLRRVTSEAFYLAFTDFVFDGKHNIAGKASIYLQKDVASVYEATRRS